ncbi:50S ribosomal protein L25/general stress protein Ctc [Kordiimonas sp. SCSIO 12603]|uniref:50S ribosomal protein L25/general stress protein Ctc n=1 Tax=Kordiimonas sp. SCSIO 12603 TaxID=2829596 RepID=UPI0021084751|nr:50S ribosomal protein L25/general stress protein Ctc [Kordiimonas sp. SCSIO 12603]UTW60108.1 50S ribosomal protein L25/general stress protein Ctc [Kordiimonas sp. SCSIO 12603]
MAKVITIEAEARDRIGKGASRAARRAGFVPAVIYGDSKEPESIQIARNEIVRLLNRGGFMSHTYEIKVDGKKKATVLPRDLQLHPVSDAPLHIDFLRLGKGATVVMSVPVKVTGEEESAGLKRGGVINHTRHEIELNVPADSIPEFIEASVADLDLGEAVKISNVTLPKGVTPTITDRDFVICAIVAPSGLKSAENAAADADAGEEAAATEE